MRPAVGFVAVASVLLIAWTGHLRNRSAGRQSLDLHDVVEQIFGKVFDENELPSIQMRQTIKAKEQAALLRLHKIHLAEAMRYEKLLNETRVREEAHRKQHLQEIRRALQTVKARLHAISVHVQRTHRKFVIHETRARARESKRESQRRRRSDAESRRAAERRRRIAARTNNEFQRFVSADRRRQTSSWNHADHHHHLISKSVRSKRKAFVDERAVDTLAEENRQHMLLEMHKTQRLKERLADTENRIQDLLEQRRQALFQAANNKQRYLRGKSAADAERQRANTAHQTYVHMSAAVRRDDSKIARLVKLEADARIKVDAAEKRSLRTYVQAERFEQSIQAAKLAVFKDQSESHNATDLARDREKLKELRQLSHGAELIRQQKEYGQEYERLHGKWAEYEHQANLERTRRDHLQETATQAHEAELRYDADANATMLLAHGQAVLSEEHLETAHRLKMQADAIVATRERLALEEASAMKNATRDNAAAVHAVRTLDRR